MRTSENRIGITGNVLSLSAWNVLPLNCKLRYLSNEDEAENQNENEERYSLLIEHALSFSDVYAFVKSLGSGDGTALVLQYPATDEHNDNISKLPVTMLRLITLDLSIC